MDFKPNRNTIEFYYILISFSAKCFRLGIFKHATHLPSRRLFCAAFKVHTQEEDFFS